MKCQDLMIALYFCYLFISIW